MSMAALERAIIEEARKVLNNPSLKLNQIEEWSSSEQIVEANLKPTEIMIHCPKWDVWVAVEVTRDKRARKP